MSESVSVVRGGCVTYVCKDIFNWVMITALFSACNEIF